jgi:hypothetical protein
VIVQRWERFTGQKARRVTTTVTDNGSVRKAG